MVLERCYYYLTYRCNSRCSYCDIWSVHRLLGEERGIETIGENLRALKNLGVRYVDFTGGEVFLRDDLPQILSAAREIGFPIIVTTSGLAYDRHAEALVGVADYINFSLDTLDEREYLARRGVDGLGRVIRSIGLARRLGQECGVIATIDSRNAARIGEMVAFCRRIGVKLTLNPVFAYSETGEAVCRDALEKIYDLVGGEDVYVNDSQIEFIALGGNKIERPQCRAMTRNIVISPDNYLLMPCFHHQKDKIKIDNNLEEIVQSDRYLAMRKNEGRFPFCSGCTINCYMDTASLRVEELAGARACEQKSVSA